MIIIKKTSLYIVTALVLLLLVAGELRFFLAIQSIETHTNLDFKYEVESFIFASIVLTLVVVLFLVYFIRKSENILKRLDKMIELSEYGKHDISAHLKKIGKLGNKVEYLLYHYKRLNEMKSLKISSLSGMTGFLVARCEAPLFVLDRSGIVQNCSDGLSSELKTEKKVIIGSRLSVLFKDTDPEELFFDLEKSRVPVTKESMGRTIVYYPIMNSENEVANVIGVIEK